MGYDTTTLQQTTIFNVTPNGTDGGIWQGGQGLVADDANNIYLMTGNGTFDVNVSGKGTATILENEHVEWSLGFRLLHAI